MTASEALAAMARTIMPLPEPEPRYPASMCCNGHPYVDGSWLMRTHSITKRSYRQCRACLRVYERRYRRRKRR